jgi:hypothetical protein
MGCRRTCSVSRRTRSPPRPRRPCQVTSSYHPHAGFITSHPRLGDRCSLPINPLEPVLHNHGFSLVPNRGPALCLLRPRFIGCRRPIVVDMVALLHFLCPLPYRCWQRGPRCPEHHLRVAERPVPQLGPRGLDKGWNGIHLDSRYAGYIF